MGFLSSLTGGQSTKIPGTGYYNLPKGLQSQYSTFYNAIPGATTAEAFTLPDFNQDQQSAFGLARGGLNRTAEDVNALIAPYQNPYEQSVIDTINRESVGQNSLLKQNQNEAGAFGSNRAFLGANDVDLTRLNQIGQFKAQGFNNSLNTALGQEQNTINNLLNTGGQQQNQVYQNQLAPYNALQAQAGLLNPVVNYMGNSQQPQTVKTGGGLGGLLGAASNIAGLASGIGSLGSAAGFGLSTGGQGFFSGGLQNAVNSARGFYGPGF